MVDLINLILCYIGMNPADWSWKLSLQSQIHKEFWKDWKLQVTSRIWRWGATERPSKLWTSGFFFFFLTEQTISLLYSISSYFNLVKSYLFMFLSTTWKGCPTHKKKNSVTVIFSSLPDIFHPNVVSIGSWVYGWIH